MRYKIILLTFAATALIFLSSCAYDDGARAYGDSNAGGYHPTYHPEPQETQVFTETTASNKQNDSGAYVGVSAGAARS